MQSKTVQLAIGFGVLALGLGLFGWFVTLFLKASVEVQTSILALFGVVVASIITHVSAKKRDIQARQFQEKRVVYEEFMTLIFDVLADVKRKELGRQALSQKKLAQRMLEFKRKLIIWADAKSIEMWNEIEKQTQSTSTMDPLETLLLWDKFMRQMRLDLGMNDSTLPPGALVDMVLIPEDMGQVGSKASRRD